MPPLGNEKKMNFHFWNLKWKFSFWKEKIEIFHLCHQENFEMIFFGKKIIFELWNGNFYFLTRGKWKKNWNKEIIYFVYTTKKKTTNNTPVPPMHTTLYHMLSRGGIQLISTVGSFHIVPFPIVVYRVVRQKIMPMTIPLDASGLNFRAGPGLWRIL
jgi:hypothetical protein